MTDTNGETPKNHPTFLELTDSDSSDSVEAPSSQPAGRLSKSERYEISRVEKSIKRRVRRDGTGKPAYDVSVWVNSRALSKTFTTLRDARRWRDEMLGQRATGSARIPADRRITVTEFVTSHWYPWLEEQQSFGNLQLSTVSWNKSGSRRLISEIGHVKMSNVGKRELRGMLAHRVDAGDSESVIRQLRASTRSVLALAVEHDVLTEDPSGFMVGRNAPRSLKRSDDSVKAWSEIEAQTFLRHVEGDPFEVLWILLLGSGLRRGEALGLRWDDIDFQDRTVSVSRSLGVLDGTLMMSYPKTKASTRTISVGSSVIDALRDYRRKQAEARLAAVSRPSSEGHIFVTESGGMVRPEFVTRRLKYLVSEAGLPWIRLHGLRHTMASLALQNGVDIATVSERLGHADTNITARIYLHGSKESDRAAASTLDAIFARHSRAMT
jgi:integrase